MRVDVPRLLAALGVAEVNGGRELRISCPLGTHRDSDPSFDIISDPGDEKNGFWRCYGCHESGGPVRLVRLVLGYDGRDAGTRARAFIEQVAAGSVSEGPREDELRVEHAVRLFGPRPFRPTDAWTAAPLEKWPGPLRSYALSRDITPEQIDRWGIGYAAAGRLAGRVVFPIRDEEGRLGSYAARSALGSRVRYLTPPREENPDPAAIWGRQHWPPRRAREVLALAEGAINALALERAARGRFPVGALGGSDDSAAQFAHLASFRALLLFADPDRAGKRLAEALSLAGGPEVILAELPPGTDAQSAPLALVREKIETLLVPRVYSCPGISD